MKVIIETKLIDGKPAHRFEGQAEGAWYVAGSSIDAIIEHVARELDVRAVEVYDAIDVDYSSISRCRTGKLPVQDKWLVRLQQFSGIPVTELLRVGCVVHPTYPHPKARRAA